MKKTFINLLLLVMTFALSACGNKAPQNDYEKFMEKIRADFYTNPDMGEINDELKLYDSEKGCFTDIDYTRDDRTHWPPIYHLKRLLDFSYAYTNKECPMYEDETLYNAVVKGLDFWYDVNPECDNWWFNQIAEPQALGLIMIQMRAGKERVPAETEKKNIDRMIADCGDPGKWTGANRTDVALHWLYRACLIEDETTLKVALEHAFSPIFYTTEEGFQHDNSYMQHGRQLYIGGYGDEILKGVTQIASYTAGTKYAIPEDKMKIMSKFMLNTYYQAFRGKYMLFDVLGRSISRPDILDKEFTAKFAERMVEIDKGHAAEFQLIADRLRGKVPVSEGLKSLHTHYFGSDYTLHVRPKFTFDTRMVTTRTMRCEYGNRENLDTYFLSDGCTNIVRQGNEYFNIFPVWDWFLIPGVTAPQMDKMPMTKTAWQNPGTSTYAGGVSDSIYGASAYSYYDKYDNINTGVNKSWFYFDNEIVCLGNVSSHAGKKVRTSINQCLVNDADIFVNNGKAISKINKGQFAYSNPEWAFHNGVGYVFPEGGNVFVYNQKQTGSWYRINNGKEKDLKEHDVFTIGLNYGINPKNKSYAYVVVPTVDNMEEMEAYAGKQHIEIVKNNKDVQSVYHKELDILQAAFFSAGSLQHGDMKISVDKNCIVMLRNNKLYISDPEQKQASIHIAVTLDGKKTELTADYKDSGIYAGATKVFSL